jgi:hypothetical protein
MLLIYYIGVPTIAKAASVFVNVISGKWRVVVVMQNEK